MNANTDQETTNAKQRKAARERARRAAKKEAAALAAATAKADNGGGDNFGDDDFEDDYTEADAAKAIAVEAAIEAEDAEVGAMEVEEPVPPTLPSQPNPATTAVAEPSKKGYDYRGDAKEAAARLRSTVGKLEKWDWSRFGVDGVRGAIEVLRRAMVKLDEMPTRAGGFHVGQEVVLRASAPATYTKTLSDAEKAALVVVELRGPVAVVSVGVDTRTFIPVRFLSAKGVAQ